MMTVHVLHAGDGYTYLTRQVASGDVARERGQSLTDYYLAHGNPPGQWVGSGRESLGVSGQVSEAQMKALFGDGLHPDADRLITAAIDAGASVEKALSDVRLGRRFPRFSQDQEDGWRAAISDAYAAFRVENDRLPEPGVERDLVRWNVARQLLGADAGDATVARFLAARGAGARQAVAGYDLVFTPAKSVSTLWALGSDEVREQVGQAHAAAWREALAWVEREAALTRVGAGGVGQVQTRGLVAVAFDHLDSRTGDPNLHTHVAVSTKVQGLDGKWRSLDGRVLHALGVAASERYNTAVEAQLRDRLGVAFVDEVRVAGRQPVREIAGVDASVRAAFSARRASIEAAYEELLAGYRARHGHEAPRVEQYRLAQQATLATRTAKTSGAPLRERLGVWRATAAQVLGGPERVDAMIDDVLARGAAADLTITAGGVDAVSVEDLVEQAMGDLASKRATWTRWNVEAAAQRIARAHAPTGAASAGLAEQITAGVLGASVALTVPEANPVPAVMRRADGASIYTVHGADRYTSTQVLAAEDRLVGAAAAPGGLVVEAEVFEAAVAQVAATSGRRLNGGQVDMARRFACGGHLVEAGIGPAGTGKTTAMTAFARAVQDAGGRVLALAPSAAAAAVLGAELDVPADTLHKLLHAYRTAAGDPDRPVPDELVVDARTVLLVDEAGMAGTLDLAAVVDLAAAHGAAVRLLGDPRQLAAVGAGGALRLIDDTVGAAHLEQVHRFTTPGEAQASLLLRDGQTTGLDFYVDHARTVGGSVEAMREDLYGAWTGDIAAGKDSVMVAATTADVVELAARARLDRVTAGLVEAPGVELHDGTRAGVGDTVVTRRNDRTLRAGTTDWVRNGDRWTVTNRTQAGDLHVQHLGSKVRTVLPAAYVEEFVELGYAATVHRVQGMTVDTSHTLVAPTMTREHLYTALTRGRHTNRAYVVVDEVLDVDLHSRPAPQRAVRAALEQVLARDGAELSATATLDGVLEHAPSLARLVPAYEDAYTRLLDPTREARLEDTVRAAVPQIADDVLSDPAWPALAGRLAQHEIAGTDVPELLAAAAAARSLDDAESLAQVLHHRVGDPTTTADPGGRLPGWIPAPPTTSTGVQQPAPDIDVAPAGPGRAFEPAVAAWLDRQADLIAERLDHLAEQVRTNPPTWAQDIDLDDPAAAAALRPVLAYRDRYQITSPTHALGTTSPAPGTQEAAHTAAARALDTAPRGAGDSAAPLRDLATRVQTLRGPATRTTTDTSTALERLTAMRAAAQARASAVGDPDQPTQPESDQGAAAAELAARARRLQDQAAQRAREQAQHHDRDRRGPDRGHGPRL